jgi:hypothetical protein
MYTKQSLAKLKEKNELVPEVMQAFLVFDKVSAGATDAEIVEAAMVATALRAGGAVIHATHALARK